MGAPRKKFRERPKITGARKKQKVKAQKKRLMAAGMEEKQISKLTDKEVRQEHKKIGRKKKN